jgi:hypothetical protein
MAIGIGAWHVQRAGMTQRGQAVGGSSYSRQLSPGGYSAEVISNGCSNAKGKGLVQRVCEHLLPAAQAWWLRRSGPPVPAPGTRNRHIDLFYYLIPGQALVAQLQDLIGGGGMCGRTARTHVDAGTAKLFAGLAPMNAQLGTNLAQSPALGVQPDCTLNVHGATVMAPVGGEIWTVTGPDAG